MLIFCEKNVNSEKTGVHTHSRCQISSFRKVRGRSDSLWGSISVRPFPWVRRESGTGRRPVSSYSGINNSSTVSCSSFARANAKDNVGSYLSFSIAFTVCRDTLHLFASSSCDSPRAFRLLLMIFFISVAIPFLII